MHKAIPIAASLALLAAAPAYASESDPGAEKAKACAACHGVDGNSKSPDFPRLAGQHKDYLLQALEGYKSGARKNALMMPMVEKLTHRDMEEIAAYFSSQRGLSTKY